MATDRATFLARVRAALGRDGPARPEPPPRCDDELVRLAGPDDDLVERFTKGATAVGMEVVRTDAAALPGDLVALLLGAGARRVVLALDDAGALADALRGAGIEVVDPAGIDDLYEGVDAGITGVAAAIAETGTLVLHTSARSGRGDSLVPPRHVALVSCRDVLPDMVDYWRSASAARPSSRVFVTGPSKTADIEGELVRGVHGPADVHVLLVADADAVA